MPGVEQLPRIIPLIVRLFPQLVRQTFYRGSVVVANDVRPSTDTELERNLREKIKQKKKDQERDNQMVIKVADAIACIEEKFNNTTIVKEFILVAVQSLWEGVQTQACGQRMFDAMAKCIREKALRQDTPRSAHRETTHGRPARGHGHGHR